MKLSLFALAVCCLTSIATAQTVVTSFARGDGFASRRFDPVTLSSDGLSATFIGGVQEQSFDGPAYNTGPDAYFFINGTYTGTFGVRPLTGNTDVGTIDFNLPVAELSFNAADRANGTPTLRILGTDGSVLVTETITATSNGSGSSRFTFASDTIGGLIGGVEFDNAGPAGNPPYAIAIDSFAATAATVSTVPEPSSLVILAATATGVVLRRRRRR